MAAPARHTDRSTANHDDRGALAPVHRLLTSAEAAAFLTLKESTLRDYSRRGLVPSVKIGRHLRFVEADLIRYLDGLRQQPLESRLDTGFGRRRW
jgi:excisionase family DNA binding protein